MEIVIQEHDAFGDHEERILEIIEEAFFDLEERHLFSRRLRRFKFYRRAMREKRKKQQKADKATTGPLRQERGVVPELHTRITFVERGRLKFPNRWRLSKCNTKQSSPLMQAA